MQIHLNKKEIWLPILILFIAASFFRILGAFLGGILSKTGKKNAFTVACGLNTPGSMGVIVSIIAYEMDIFNDLTFSTVVLVCVLSSLCIGPLLKWAIKGVKRPLAKYFDKEHVFLDVEGKTKEEIIENITTLMFKKKIITNRKQVKIAIWEREKIMSTAIGEGVALPHARIPKFKKTLLCFFRLIEPVDFLSPDDKPVQLLFLELTDSDDDGMQLNLISQVAKFISIQKNRQKLYDCKREDDLHHILSFDEKI